MDPQTPQDQNQGQGQGQTGAGQAQDDSKYNIPPIVLKKYADLVELIKKTESMSAEERDYWFQILPIMTDDQVTRLRKILTEESEQLAKLDSQYQNELGKLNKKHLNEWDEFEKRKEREGRKEAEESAEEKEAQEEEVLLGSLDGANNTEE